MRYALDVAYARATPSNQLLIDRVADEWLALACRTDGDAHALAIAKAAYWRSVLTAAFPHTQLSKNHGL